VDFVVAEVFSSLTVAMRVEDWYSAEQPSEARGEGFL
jgi:hypothetical protein